MKKLFLLFPYLFFLIAANAQMPKTINYQAVARNAAGQPLTSKTMKVRLSILKTASNSIYSETRTITTNVSGLFNIEIGSTGALSTTGNFKTINWTKGNP